MKGEWVKNVYVKTLMYLNHISVAMIFLTALWIFSDVAGRYLFGRPIPGTTELIKTAIVAIVFLGLPYAQYEKKHIRTTLIKLFPDKLRWSLEIVASLLGAAAFTLVSIYGWDAAVKAFVVKEFEGVQLQIPTYPSRFIVVLGSALLVIQFLVDLGATLRKGPNFSRRDA